MFFRARPRRQALIAEEVLPRAASFFVPAATQHFHTESSSVRPKRLSLHQDHLKEYSNMPKFINPFTDVGFKRIFGQEINKDLLIDFLNALLEGERQVKDIQFLDKELLPMYENDRRLIYDVYCTDENGEQFIVEMQNKEHVNFRERTIFYLSQAIARQGEKGVDWRFDLKAVYGVFFLNFMLTDLPRKLRTDIVLADRVTHEQFSDKMRYIFLQLPLFTKEESECDTDFERWIYVLKNMETLQRLPFKARNAVFQKLEEIVDIAAMSKEDRMKYDESIKVYRDRLAIIEYERRKGLAEGLAKGERNKQIEIACNLKRMGLATETIAQATGLAPEAIEQL